MHPQVLTTGQVAKLCWVSSRTVQKWVDQGMLRGHRLPGSKDRRISRVDVELFAKKHGMPLNEPAQVEAKDAAFEHPDLLRT